MSPFRHVVHLDAGPSDPVLLAGYHIAEFCDMFFCGRPGPRSSQHIYSIADCLGDLRPCLRTFRTSFRGLSPYRALLGFVSLLRVVFSGSKLGPTLICINGGRLWTKRRHVLERFAREARAWHLVCSCSTHMWPHFSPTRRNLPLSRPWSTASTKPSRRGSPRPHGKPSPSRFWLISTCSRSRLGFGTWGP